MAAWPGSLPNLFLEGLVYAPVDQSISTEMDTGPPKRRRRFSVSYAKISAPLILTGAELATFETFWETTLLGGSQTFTITDPSDGATITVQFSGVPSWSAMRPSGAAGGSLWSGMIKLDRVA